VTDERSASEILVEAMEEFGRCEPRKVVITWTNENDDVVLKTNARRAECVGLLEIAHKMALNA
jgi:hypothetical protein